MKINHSGNSPAQGAESSRQSGKASGAQESKRPQRGSGVESEKVSNGNVNTEISSKSREFANARAVASRTPDVREDRVADLKRRISEGTYKVDADAVADRMVDDHMRMQGA